MSGLGTIVNIGAIIAGTLIGLALKGGLPLKIRETVMKVLGLATVFIGITGVLTNMITVNDGVLSVKYMMLVIVSLAIGSLAGELIDIEARLERFGEFCKRLLNRKNPQTMENPENRFVEGFVAASLLFCVGAMAIVGSLQDGLTGNAATLYAKSVLDGISSVILSATMGIGVMLSAFTVAVYQGGITLGAKAISPLLSPELIAQLSAVGSVLIFAIGLNMILGKKVKVGNMLPAMLIPPIYGLILFLAGK